MMTAPSDVPDFNGFWSSPLVRRETTVVRECVFEVCVGVIPVSFAPLSSALVSQKLLIFVVWAVFPAQPGFSLGFSSFSDSGRLLGSSPRKLQAAGQVRVYRRGHLSLPRWRKASAVPRFPRHARWRGANPVTPSQTPSNPLTCPCWVFARASPKLLPRPTPPCLGRGCCNRTNYTFTDHSHSFPDPIM